VRKPLLVGVAQVPVAMGDKQANVAALFRYLDAAVRAKCGLVLFPECSFAGWLSPSGPRAAEPVPGPFLRRLSAYARKHRIAIAGGFEERDGSRIYNSAVLVGPDGALLRRHRKIDELEIGLRMYTRGDSLGVVEFAGRLVGLDICADSWKPEITDALAAMGAELILSPCAWAVDPGGEATNLAWIRETYRLRTAGRKLTIVAADGVGPVTEGPWKGRILQGNSLATGPDGKLLLEGPTSTPALLTLKLP
jgi:predicted amidohydrolase